MDSQIKELVFNTRGICAEILHWGSNASLDLYEDLVEHLTQLREQKSCATNFWNTFFQCSWPSSGFHQHPEIHWRHVERIIKNLDEVAKDKEPPTSETMTYLTNMHEACSIAINATEEREEQRAHITARRAALHLVR